jgi:hypothetical protein
MKERRDGQADSGRGEKTMIDGRSRSRIALAPASRFVKGAFPLGHSEIASNTRHGLLSAHHQAEETDLYR